MLPSKEKVTDLKKWAVVACDQYTSEPEYWKRVDEFVGGDSPSTLRITFPEVYLEKGRDEKIIRSISETMKNYESTGIFEETKTHGVVVVERTFRDGQMRRGVILALDLEKYDYKPNSQTVIRATEKTIESRIPPRLKVRREVSIELPHIIVLIDDPNDTVIGTISQHLDTVGRVVYETELMENSGYLKGVWIDDSRVLEELGENLLHLSDSKKFQKKYSLPDNSDLNPLVFAMGDGNHSLATAKARWEEVKANGADFQNHPARYALVEIQNCQDPTLVFEPINRLIEGIDIAVARQDFADETSSLPPTDDDGVVGAIGGERLLNEFKYWLESTNQGPIVIAEGEDAFGDVLISQPGTPHGIIGYVLNGLRGSITITNPKKVLPVATFTDFIDPWLTKNSTVRIDYVHETTAIDRECIESKHGNIGFVFPSMEKSDLFKTVIFDGVLPRKTFSMGASHDKRFYFEGRRIV